MQTQRCHVEGRRGALAAPTPRLATDLRIPEKSQNSISEMIATGELHGRPSCIVLTPFERKEDPVPSTATFRAPAVHRKHHLLGHHHGAK